MQRDDQRSKQSQDRRELHAYDLATERGPALNDARHRVMSMFNTPIVRGDNADPLANMAAGTGDMNKRSQRGAARAVARRTF